LVYTRTAIIPFFDSKKTTGNLGQRHKPGTPCVLLFIRLTKFAHCEIPSNKKGNSDGSVGSKSKLKKMKSSETPKIVAKQKRKNKKENALGVISKSVQSPEGFRQ